MPKLRNNPFRLNFIRIAFVVMCCVALFAHVAPSAVADETDFDGNPPESTEIIVSEDLPDEAPPIDNQPVEEIAEPEQEPDPTDVSPDDPVVVPTEPIVESTATEVVAEPTVEEATETPSPTPTETPSPTPTPTATAAPKPFDPNLACTRIEGGAAPVAGSPDVAWLDCTLNWDTEHVEQVSVEATTSQPGWSLIAIDPESLGTDGLIMADTSLLDLHDSDPSDEGFSSARFLIGSRFDCTASPSADVTLELTATSHASEPQDDSGPPVVETAVRQMTESGAVAGAPNVTVTSASFSPIDAIPGGPLTSTGVIEFAYSGASPSCGWSAIVTFANFVAGDEMIPSSNLSLLQVLSESADLSGTSAEGTIALIAAPSEEGSPSAGSVEIQVQLRLLGFVPQGDYQSTVTVETQAPR